MSKKIKILCFGDSNTWGDPPGSDGRFDFQVRWPGVLQANLGEKYQVIEDGLCGRTNAFDDPDSPGRNGLTALPKALTEHSPLDAVIIMLGTNDLKSSMNLTTEEIAEGAGKLVKLCQKCKPNIAQILLVSPAHVAETTNQEIRSLFKDGISRSKTLSKLYMEKADLLNCRFFDAATVAKSSPIDGIHLPESEHKNLGINLARYIKESFPALS